MPARRRHDSGASLPSRRRPSEFWKSTNEAPTLLVVASSALAAIALMIAWHPASQGLQPAIDLIITLLVGWPFLIAYLGRVYRTRGLIVIGGVAWLMVVNSMQAIPALMNQLWGYPLIGIFAGLVALFAAAVR